MNSVASSRRMNFKVESGILDCGVLDIEVQVFHSRVVEAARPAFSVSLPAGVGDRQLISQRHCGEPLDGNRRVLSPGGGRGRRATASLILLTGTFLRPFPHAHWALNKPHVPTGDF